MDGTPTPTWVKISIILNALVLITLFVVGGYVFYTQQNIQVALTNASPTAQAKTKQQKLLGKVCHDTFIPTFARIRRYKASTYTISINSLSVNDGHAARIVSIASYPIREKIQCCYLVVC